MKKLFLSIAIFAAASFAAVAQNPAAQPEGAQVCTEKNECPKEAKSCDKQNRLFEGLDLTAEQQSKIDALRAECKAKCEAIGKEAKADKEKASNLTAEEKQKLKEEFKAKKAEAKAKFLGDMKSILTPEQYQKLLENNFLNDGGHAKKAGVKDCKKAECGKDKKDCKKAECGKDKKDCKKAECGKDKKDGNKGNRNGKKAA